MMIINTMLMPLNQLHKFKSLKLSSLAISFAHLFFIHNPYMDNLFTEMFGITKSQDFTNSYITALFANGEMKLCNDGVKFICDSP